MKKLLLISPPNDLEKEFCELIAQDFEVVNALDEKQGFEILDDDYEGISAVLVNLATTRSTDFEILRLMDQDKIFASIPVIALADHLPTPEDMDVFEKGFSELLTPPGLRQFVVNRINNAIRAKDSFTYTEMQKMLKQLPSNIYLKDSEGRYVFATQYWHHLHKEGEKHWTIRGKTDVDIRKDKQNALKAMETDQEMLRTGQGTDYIIEENDDGIQEFLELIKRPVIDEDGNITGIIALINDVTEKQLLKMELEKRSKTDQLTGLLNRGAVEDLISMLLTNYYKDGEKCALMMIDADHFKNVNDTFGHIMGDRVLATIGRIINGCFKGRDVAGRVGGDEFMIFLRDIDSEKVAISLAEKLQYEVTNAFSGELEKCVSLSIGIAMYPDHGKRFVELYNSADKALYYVKEHGRASYHIYTPD
ncbi:diguanylate cyclase (GGDEF) domain-containing protein [Lachnospiraceae bacterium NE2001]|nr:diguanylate cyclase (GGDEF) domain-containing protein [Lachnospiraceae bacterium NE2001]